MEAGMMKRILLKIVERIIRDELACGEFSGKSVP